MGDCCSAGPSGGGPSAAAPDRCPRCGAKGKRVERPTLMALLRPEARARIRDAGHRICLATVCEVVYFGGTDRFTRDDLNVRVGEKETAPDRLVCYCFGHTAASIEGEIRRTGASTVVDRIKAEIAAGRCACEVTNPEGRCCLGNVAAAARRAMSGAIPPR